LGRSSRDYWVVAPDIEMVALKSPIREIHIVCSKAVLSGAALLTVGIRSASAEQPAEKLGDIP